MTLDVFFLLPNSPVLRYGLDALPVPVSQLEQLDRLQLGFGRYVFVPFKFPETAVTGEMGWPTMSEVVVLKKFKYIDRVNSLPME